VASPDGLPEGVQRKDLLHSPEWRVSSR
jgi:hypothetical protein